MSNVIAVQFNHMTDSYMETLQLHLPLLGDCRPSPASVWTFNNVAILIAIPILDQCIYPCLRQYTPNMLKRFGISYVLLIISAGILCLYETIGHHALSHGTSDSNQSCMFDDEWGSYYAYADVSLADTFASSFGWLCRDFLESHR